MIQLYMHIHDLKPYEMGYTQKEEIIPNPRSRWKGGNYDDFLDDIRQNGIRECLKVSCQGFIQFGNGRYWAARELYEQGDKRFEYLPVQIDTFTGVKLVEFDTLPTREKLLEAAVAALSERHQTIPPKKKLKKYVLDTRRLKEEHGRFVKNRDGQPTSIDYIYFFVRYKGKFLGIFLDDSIAPGLWYQAKDIGK